MKFINMISYAQNGEDVVLRRAFPQAAGFYVDLGAGYPSVDSVTKVFYDRGWSGINIEPQPDLFELLRAARPRDINLDCAVGDEPGFTTLTTYPYLWSWATTNPKVSTDHSTETVSTGAVSIEVRVRTLDEILAGHKPPGIRIDFIKIDVEGSEAAALRSISLARWRPRALVIEATAPGNPRQTHGTWEATLLQAGYRCALFDGLNRYYARVDEPELLRTLAIPSNVFDRYIPHRYWHAMRAEKRRAEINRRWLAGEDVTALLDYPRHTAQLTRELRHIRQRQRRHPVTGE